MGLGKRTQEPHSESRDAGMFVEHFRKMRTQFVLAVFVASLILESVTGGDESRISEGRIPPPGKYPSIARLTSTEFDNVTFCVLSIINRDWLVGPAGCFVDTNGPRPSQDFTVIVGDEIINETEPYEQEHKVERFILHHRIDAGSFTFSRQVGDDIALVKVTPQIRFSNRVTAANLPTCKDFQTGIVGLVAGYGVRQKGNVWRKNHRLMEITNKIIPLDECSRRLRRPWDDRIFCVESINNMSTCLSDAGAPFYHVKSDHNMVLVGFESAGPVYGGEHCGVDGNADISTFTRLSSYVGWIHRRIYGCGNHPWWNRTEYGR